ncbi:MAG: zinc ABC transporter substrate-binding protein [Muribaculaceae bacterium]|nr:zinc ABC transporter substrate-binding protein [Muribaculaceae bacterium]
MTKHSFLPYIIVCLLVAAVVAVVTGCSSRPTAKPIITVSIQPQQYLLEQIVGDKIDVRCLLVNGGNPESYEPSLTHLMNLEKSEAYFRIGNVGFESAIIDRIRANNPNLKIYNTTDSVSLIIRSHTGIGDDDHHDHSHEIDPHTWSSVRNGKIIATNMYNAVVNMDPRNEKYYTNRYAALMTRLDSLDLTITRMLEPKRGMAFMVWHPSLSYFARDYGLKQVSMSVEGKEMSVQAMKSRINGAKEKSAAVFFSQKDFDTRQASVLTDELDVKVVPINPLSYDWENELLGVATALAAE